MNRSENIEKLKTQNFDLCIIGAGASGTGSALDAALRGMKVALIDKSDFASETSSKSTKLIHGGVRYLEQAFMKFDFAQLRQVKHGLEERHIVLHNAPHLARELGLVTPVRTWIEGLYFTIGLKIYRLLAAGKDSLPKSRWMSKKETLKRMPTLSRKMHSAVMYYDGQLDDARYCLALAQSACNNGVALANYLQLIDFIKEKGQIVGAKIEDQLTKEKFIIRAKIFLNCTGAHADSIRQLANPILPHRIRPSKGVHMILPYEIMPSKEAMLIPKTKDGRLVFVIPFEGKTLVGTTDDDYHDIDKEPILEKKEVDFLLETLEPYLEKKIDPKQVQAGYGGLRPLVVAIEGNRDTKSLLRDHEVEHDKESNIVSLLGGKWTTYRLMARDAINYIAPMLNNNAPCTTDIHVLEGGINYHFDDWKKLHDDFDLTEKVAKHLMLKYGNNALKIAAICKQNTIYSERLHPKYPYIKAEVIYCVHNEMAYSLRDFLARRIRLEINDWEATLSSIPVVADLMQEALHWTNIEKERQITQYRNLITQFQEKIK